MSTSKCMKTVLLLIASMSAHQWQIQGGGGTCPSKYQTIQIWQNSTTAAIPVTTSNQTEPTTHTGAAARSDKTGEAKYSIFFRDEKPQQSLQNRVRVVSNRQTLYQVLRFHCSSYLMAWLLEPRKRWSNRKFSCSGRFEGNRKIYENSVKKKTTNKQTNCSTATMHHRNNF